MRIVILILFVLLTALVVYAEEEARAVLLFNINDNSSPEDTDNATGEAIAGNTPAVETPAEEIVKLSRADLARLSDDCALRFECEKRDDGLYRFGCYYDAEAGGCRCFAGSLEDCDISRSSLKEPAATEEGNASGNVTDIVGAVSAELEEARAPSYMRRVTAMVIRGPAVKRIGAAIVILFLVIIGSVWFYNRDTEYNDYHKARRFHKAAEEAYEHNNPRLAKKYYKLAEEFRGRAAQKGKG
ncbi:TPA: hypothetical protein HA317_00965 [Candidatus Woesearchaeota archaeon]|nr:hypothetical protein [Candidatus Woesearchaeota archaeon]